MTDGLAAYSTVFKVGDGATPTEVFTAVAEVSEINGFSLERAFEDGTSFDSDGWEEFIPTLRSVKEFTLKLNFVPTGATHDASTGLVAAFEAGTLDNYQIVFPDVAETTWTVPAYVKKVGIKLSAKGKLEGEISLQPSGAPTLE